jgi:glucose-1-phosphate cytidylyltransferase
MKVMILAGGYGSRISEESSVRPKPMVEIGAMPILWHIMKIYSAHGLNEFIILCGYKGHVIKDWFASYQHRFADITFDYRNGSIDMHDTGTDPWRVTLVDTGETTMTGGRIKRAARYLDASEPFCLTYGDGVSNVDIRASIAFHRSHGRKVTMTAVQPDQRFGVFSLGKDENLVTSFREKPQGDGLWVNGGFFVLDPSVISYIDGDDTVWELEPMQALASESQVVANRHRGFWMPMDTLRDKNVLEDYWKRPDPPWRIW